LFNGSVTYTNGSNAPNQNDTVDVQAFITPSCGANVGVLCTTPDLNILQMPATGVGAAGTSCADVIFNVGAQDANGESALIPQGTTLAAALNNSQTNVTLASATGFPTTNIQYFIQVGTEVMRVTGGQGTVNLTVIRGTHGSTAAAHASGDAVAQLITAGATAGGAGEPPVSCEVDFTNIKVLRVPTIDADEGTPGVQTLTLGRAIFSNGLLAGFPVAGISQETITGPLLSMTKNPQGTKVLAGQAMTFTIVITNNGSGDATNVQMNDPLPGTGALNWALAPPVAGCGITGLFPAAQTLSCTTLTVPAGGSASLILSALTAPNPPTGPQTCPDTVSNTATITATNSIQITPVVATGSSGCISLIANLSVTKNDGQTTVTPNQTVVYTVTVANAGPQAANGAIVTDPVAVGLQKTNVTCQNAQGGAVCPAVSVAALESVGGVVIATFPSGGSLDLIITATVTKISAGTVTNTVNVAPPAGTTDNDLTNNTASDTDTVLPVADLSITKTDGVTSLNLGANTIYTVVVTNLGPSEVTGATISDPAPTGLTIVSWTCSVSNAGNSVGPVVTACGAASGVGPSINTTANLKANGSVTYLITATLTATSGSVTNTVTVQPPQGTTDPTPGNNTASDTDAVNLFSYTINKSVSSSTLLPGSPVTFTVVATNNGPSSANNSVLTDPAVAGFTISGVTCGPASGGAVCPAPGSVTVAALQGAGITIATFPSGGTVTFTLTGTFTASAGSATNTATISPPPGIPVPPASSSASVTVPNHVIPTLSDLGLLLLALMMLGSAVLTLRARKSR